MSILRNSHVALSNLRVKGHSYVTPAHTVISGWFYEEGLYEGLEQFNCHQMYSYHVHLGTGH